MSSTPTSSNIDGSIVSSLFHAPTADWFEDVFDAPTMAQARAWPEIASRNNTLLLAPTGSGKTLAAFLVAIDRIMFRPELRKADDRSVNVLYLSPLKALGVDVDRNLKAPLAGIRAVAERQGIEHHVPTIAIRSGDTPARERLLINRSPPNILITTPESLYLMLTSKAREVLAAVETVVVDEIHSLVANKRGAHLFVSLERLERLRRAADPDCTPLQRIGLSATQRPLAEVARLLGGAEATSCEDESPRPRPVSVIEAGARKRLDLTIEVPVEDMTELARTQLTEAAASSDAAGAGPSVPSIWPAIHPRLVELIRAHRSTMIFTNSRRLAERLAASINELAGEEIALAHHGSVAKEMRLQIEGQLKAGQLPAIVATSSLELGIDMGAVDLVIQIESPPSIASGLQRIGRAGHQVGASSKGIVFPKYRGDLLAGSAAAGRMLAGEVEETFYPRNPLDVLAQQLVAIVAEAPVKVDELYATIRGAAPFAELSRTVFDSVLDLLAGRYPSDEFAELRPRVTWDRISGEVSPRRGTQRLAVLNGGTIPDRGLYGVFLADGSAQKGAGEAGAEVALRGGRRVGELDEEMVFETRPGDVFLLGASSWRVVDITRDRVLVVPAPGEPGRMPFWRGDGPGRPLEFGRAIGKLSRRIVSLSREQAQRELIEHHALDERAASNLVAYLHEQAAATEIVPSDQAIVVESFLDEIGDWRVAILTPFGARVHAPWATAVMARLGRDTTNEVDMMWTDDGIMFRLPESDEPPDAQQFFPLSSEVEDLVVDQLGATALFASHFRENAARSLLLPKRQPGRRTPLWLQRRKAADLLSVASRYPGFPILLETFRECLRDVFDIRGLKSILQEVETHQIQVRSIQTPTASPFASSLMFSYVGNFLYEGDAPLAERRAAALSLDQAQLRELLGDAELRELIDFESADELASELQRLDRRFPPRDADGLHDLLRDLGDLSLVEVRARCDEEPPIEGWLEDLLRQRRLVELQIAGQLRYVAVEDAARFRDALGSVLPADLPAVFLEACDEPLAQLVTRYARTHLPFKPQDIADRLGCGLSAVQECLQPLVERGRLVVGEFLPGGHGLEYSDPEVLKKLKRRALARLRKQIEPVDAEALVRFLPKWHRIDAPRKGMDGLLDAIESLQGLPLPVSDLEQAILPARVADFRVAELDELCAAGEIVWQGAGGLTGGDGRVSVFLTDNLPRLGLRFEPLSDELSQRIRENLGERGAVFFAELQERIRVFPDELSRALWDLVWNGEVTNDTLVPLRSLRRAAAARKTSSRSGRGFRSRRKTATPGSEGRWSLIDPGVGRISDTERQAAFATQLLERYGIVTRDVIAGECQSGGFSAIYPVFKAMEESGRVRRGYFVTGLGASQFAMPGAEDRLRQSGLSLPEQAVYVLAATDPANPFGTALRWPESVGGSKQKPSRSAGARIFLSGGTLLGYLNRSGNHLLTFQAGDSESSDPPVVRLAQCLAEMAGPHHAVFLEKIDGSPAQLSELADVFVQYGFTQTSRGLLHRRVR